MKSGRSLSTLFLAARPDGGGVASQAHLEQVLADIVALARSTWPSVEVSVDRFLTFVAQHIPDGSSPERVLLEMRVAELYLVCACLDGNLRALEIFERQFASEIDAALASVDSSLIREEAKDAVRHVLLIGREGETPKLAQYAGRGDLRKWLRVTAMRKAQDILRRHKKQSELDDHALVDLAVRDRDQELEYMKGMYREEFKAAFWQALGELSARERNILRHQLLDELNADQIGALYKVHRITVVRWNKKIREDLLARTRKALMTRLSLDKSEFESITRLIRSQLDVSIRRYFTEGVN